MKGRPGPCSQWGYLAIEEARGQARRFLQADAPVSVRGAAAFAPASVSKDEEDLLEVIVGLPPEPEARGRIARTFAYHQTADLHPVLLKCLKHPEDGVRATREAILD